MPKNVRFYRKNDRPKVYISLCNIVLILAIFVYTLHKKKKSTWHYHTGNYTRRNRSEDGQSQAVNSGMYNSSYSHHL